MRAHNERLVLTILRRQGPMAKAEIARATGLSAQTVSVIMRALEEDGFLVRGEPVRGRVGQPSVPMRLAPSGAFLMGLKVGRRSVELVLTDFTGAVRARAMRTHAYPHPADIVAFATARIEEMVKEELTQGEQERIAGLGIAMPFFLWNWAHHLGVPVEKMLVWKHTDLREEIARQFDFPVYLKNDASAACGAEVVFGPSGGARDFLYFYVGYFIGGGLVLNGKLFTGRGNAAALGPLPVPDGRGHVRQLVEVASLSVLEKALQAAGHDTAGLWQGTDGWQVDAAILHNWIETTAAGMAFAIVASASVIDFEEVRIDGWLPRDVRAALVQAVTREVQRLDLSGITCPEIKTGAVGPDARALGAASLPLSERFLVD